MLSWIKSIFKQPKPVGPAETIKRFSPDDAVIANDNVGVNVDLDDGAWKIEFAGIDTVALFEYPVEDVENCILTYRAKMKSEGLKGRSYQEMLCRLPDKGEFFSKGLDNPVIGNTDWKVYEVPFYLKKDQKPDLLKINVFGEGTGTVWIKDIEILKTPLA